MLCFCIFVFSSRSCLNLFARRAFKGKKEDGLLVARKFFPFSCLKSEMMSCKTIGKPLTKKKKKMNLVKTIYWYKNVYVEVHGMP